MPNTPRGISAQAWQLRRRGAIIAPLSTNTAIGKAKVVVDGQTIATYELFPVADVPEAGFFGRAWDSLRLMFN